jgi:hypothetical protein
MLRKGQKNCFDALVSNGLVGSLLDEYEKQNPLNFTSLLTLCAHKDIPGLTLLTDQNIPEIKDSWGDIAQQHKELQREELRLERQNHYKDVNSDIINMSLDLTEDEFKDCYWQSLELKESEEDEDEYYPLLNTDRLKRSLRNILSSKIR